VTAPAELCAGCHKALDRYDRFCARCGTPTARHTDPEVTLVDPVGIDAPADSAPTERRSRETAVPAESAPTQRRSRETAVPAESSPAQAPANFNVRLQQVLGAEYDLIALTGQGGFARVYRAKDKRLNRIVAIKVVKPELLATKELVERFRAEGIVLAKLRHPGIVPIYDIRERDGLIYYIMPFVQGTTLETRLERLRLPPFETRRILAELADALAAAHRAKMIHLDIKPANVFLEGDLGKVLLMDFGIAKALTDQVTNSDGEPIVGTPEYMSPEQAQGLAEIDHRSDVYSLGALGYRMLVGRPPFRGDTITDILAKHVHETPKPIREINPTVPKELADAVMRCLAKDPWKRFSTALELRATLDAVSFFTRAGEPVTQDDSRGLSRVLVAALGFVLGILIGMALK
jgi:serine/threonine protein kinase